MWRGKRSGSSESCSSPRTAHWAGWEVCSVTQGGGFPEPLRPPGSVAYSPGMKSQIGHRCPSSLPFLPERGSDGKYWERDGERRSAWPGLAQEGCGGLMEGALDSLKEAETWLALLLVRQTHGVFCVQGPQQGGFFSGTAPHSNHHTNSHSPFRSLGTLLACCSLHVPFRTLATVGWVDSWDCSPEATWRFMCAFSLSLTQSTQTPRTPRHGK